MPAFKEYDYYYKDFRLQSPTIIILNNKPVRTSNVLVITANADLMVRYLIITDLLFL